MKLSKKFLNDYLDIQDVDFSDVAEKMTSIGNEYDDCSKLINASNLVIGEIIECKEHPDSDHLHVCMVNVGNENLQIVCGAPNARKGIKVIVAKDGAVLPQIKIKKGVIRGVESNGMLCSIQELGLDNKFLKKEDIEGICELSSDAPIGENPITYLNYDDEVIDFELTSNRGDLLSIIGMAYEIGAIYNKKVKKIDTDYSKYKDDMNINLDVKTDKCSLFIMKKASNVVIKDSPDFIQKRLIASGIRPINNVVDISNYVMLETGQPLHFYDYDKLSNSIIVRNAFKNEKLVTLDNIERTLSEDDIVIANENEAIGLAGVMGGLSTEVTNDTKNILIESAIFDSVSVRLTSKKILRSEASNRFEKGLDPKRTYLAIERSCHLLEKYADAKIVEETKEYCDINICDKSIDLKISDVNKLLGLSISKEEICNIFDRLSFDWKDNDDILTVIVPTRRQDISIKEDLIEEVARIYGIDKITGVLPNLPIKKGSYNKFIRQIRHKLSSLGLNETLSYTLIPNSESHKFTMDNFEEINLLDPMTDDRKTLRYSIIPSLMMIYDYNNKRNNKDISIFEMGKSFKNVDNQFLETNHLGILMSGKYFDGIKKDNVDFYYLKGILEELLDSLGYANRYSLLISDFPKEFHPGASAWINLNGQNVGIIGKIHPNITKDDIYVLEMDLDLIRSYSVKKLDYKEISKYPSISKDVAFVVDKNICNETIIKEIKRSGGKYLVDVDLFDYYDGDKIDENKKSLAYNLIFNDKNNTLTDEIIMPIFNKIISDVCSKFEATIRDK